MPIVLISESMLRRRHKVCTSVTLSAWCFHSMQTIAMNTSLENMRTLNFLTLALTIVGTLLTACGGGGGGGNATAPTPAPAKMSALSAPTVWPASFKSVIVNQTSLVTSADLSLTTNNAKTTFIQIWYLNQDQQRQTVAILTLYSLTQMGGNLTIPNVPTGVKALASEVYTSNGSDQLTLANKEIGV